jgi:hypothetical protein
MLHDEPYNPYASMGQREAKPISPWWYILAITSILKMVGHSLAEHPVSIACPQHSASPNAGDVPDV